MNVVYDIRNQNQPKEFILIIAGIIIMAAFVIFLLRVILYFCGKTHMDKIELILSIIGIFVSPIMSVMFISMDVNTITNFRKYCNELDNNNCSVVIGQPIVIREYEVNVLNEELLIFDIDGKEFDTMNLYRTKNGLSQEQVDAIKNSDSITVKYIESNDVNWIVYIGVKSENRNTGDGSLS